MTFNLLCHSLSTRDTLNTNPARTEKGVTKSMHQVTVCMIFECLGQCLCNDGQITYQKQHNNYVRKPFIISRILWIKQILLIQILFISYELIILSISYPVNILRIISSNTVIFSWVIENLLFSDSTRGPSVRFFFSASNCLRVVSRCAPSILATVMKDVTSWRPINEATWR